MPTADQPTAAWHTLNRQQVEEQLQTSAGGLTDDVARSRLAAYGPNELQAGQKVSVLKILLAQFQNILLLILIIATVISAAMGHGTETIVIGIIVLFAVGLGFYQEFRAERAMEALQQMAAPQATVIRGGKESHVPARDLVPGDLVLLKAGDKVPADCRLVEVVNLQAEEAALTGESVPSEKQAERLGDENLPVGDRKNIAYSGTAATYGRGRGIVVATGMSTEFGKIARMLQSVERQRTPLQDNLDRVGRTLAKIALVIVLVIVGIGLARGETFTSMLIFGIALAVAVVPEALPAVVTVSLAIGVQRMVKRNALIRRLPAVETLGSTSVICSDKTGTLTRDEMTVRRLYAAGQELSVSGAGYEPEGEFTEGNQPVELPEHFRELLRAGVLASDAKIVRDEAENRWRVEGDPTEGALVAVAGKANLAKAELDAEYPRIAEVPFSSETKRMTTLHEGPGGTVAYAKGAPEMLLESCSRLVTAEGDAPITDDDRNKLKEVAVRMGSDALRVIALAKKEASSLDDATDDLVLLGLAGMIDPPRAEAKEAVKKCEDAGIKVVMITGDHPITAKAVAGELGIVKQGRVVSGKELDQLDDEQLAREVEQIEVYARVSPAHKLRVVTALQKRSHVVAMTGDGVNDAPALRKADIGIAMGITGTDVTKEAAEMTLTDDNFASIVAAVEEGRGIFGNIKKYLMYLLSANLGEIGLMAGASLAGLPLPLSAVQILYINLATDGLPALALALDPPEDDLMSQPPRSPRTGIFTPSVLRLITAGGIWSAIANLTLFGGALWLNYPEDQAMTMTFVSLVLMEFFKAYGYRSDHQHVLHRPFVNKWLNLAIGWEIVLLLLILHVPFLQRAFGVSPFGLAEWALIVFWSHTILPVLEMVKGLERRGTFDGRADIA
jgi:Ca2+-transporting ATPase